MLNKVFSVLDASSNQTRHAKHQTLYFKCFIWLIYVQTPPIWALNVSGNFPENYVREISRYRRGRSCCWFGAKVMSKTIHNRRLMQVLERARKSNLKLNKSKRQIKKDTITYIGHILSKDGLKPDLKKIEPIFNMPCPPSRKQRVGSSPHTG